MIWIESFILATIAMACIFAFVEVWKWITIEANIWLALCWIIIAVLIKKFVM